MLHYNPVIKNGKFQCSGLGKKFTFRAIDIAEAKYKFITKFHLGYTNEVWQLIETSIIEPTVRQFDNK